ncbi:MAG: hypothetical protein ABSG03_09440 [Bryobacteraceae bacterium]
MEAEVPPERVMSDFKTYSSRRLNRMRLDEPNRKRWARHVSTRWLWKPITPPVHVSAAIQYVVESRAKQCPCSSLTRINRMCGIRSLTVAAPNHRFYARPLLCRAPGVDSCRLLKLRGK